MAAARRLRVALWGFASLLLLLPGAAAWAQAACEAPVARLVSAQGPVALERGPAVRPVALDDALCPGDVVRVGPRGRAALALADGGVLRLDQNTILRAGEAGAAAPSLFGLLTGALHFLSRTRRALEVNTPFVNAGIEGTEFVLRVLPDRALLTVYEGRVRFENPRGRVLVAGGQAAEAVAGRAPELLRIVVRPRDAVQWALYYPPVLTPLAAPGEAPGDLPPALAEAAAAAGGGDPAAAFARLERVPEAERDATFHALRAGLLLSVGRADEARADIERALALQPEAAEALALRAVIAVVQDDRERALADARRALELEPGSAAAALALSYALQARFELDEARDVLRGAVARHPADPLLRARLAELELMFEDVGAARAEVETAVALGPDLGRAWAVRGFVALAELDTAVAEEAFARAITLEPDAPLPHLGLGLALIRENELEAGRREIEVAAGLDPNDALLRSYLGKAYFEERRDAAAAEAFATAKELDPLDPTPFFYDAIREQLDNRPVEALRDLERAIELNENRAVFRSRLLLDEDRAARTVSLARIYEDLGLDQLAVTEAATSLSTAPANSSAHRFLSDAYAELPRHEIARVSEVLQAQLLQPLTGEPVPPRLAVSDLSVIAGGGPEAVGFNEFTPLFERERPRLLVSGLVGNNETWGEEAVLSGLLGRFAYSFGQFHSETDGWRPNSDVENTLYNAFGQVQLTPSLSVQTEYRHRDTERGDVTLNFDPDDFSRTDRQENEQDIARIGLHFAPSPRSDVLASFIYTDQEVKFSGGTDPFGSAQLTNQGYQAEAQYVFHINRLNLVAGVGRYDIDASLQIMPLGADLDFSRKQDNVYVYTNVNFPDDAIWTAGLSYDYYKQRPIGTEKLSPKVGVLWNITNGVQLRAAAFQTVKRALVVDQTIEPTHVAGFNQFFDDFNGAVAKRYAIGLDARLAASLYGGLEASRRDVDIPSVGLDQRTGDEEEVREDTSEDLYRAYLYWTPHLNWAITAEARFNRFKSGGDPNFAAELPAKVETVSVPLAVRYFSPLGLFAELGATYVHQEVERRPGATLAEESDGFVLLDATLGYRLPNRRGILSVEATNLLDEGFSFQDDNFRSSEARPPPFVPDRTLLARITLNF